MRALRSDLPAAETGHGAAGSPGTRSLTMNLAPAATPRVQLLRDGARGTPPIDRAARPLIVDDDQPPEPGQLTQRDFLARLRGAVVDTADAVLGPTWSAAACPDLPRIFDHYADLDAARLERIMQRYARVAAAMSALEYVAAACARLAPAIARWADGADVSWQLAPSGLPAGIDPGGDGPTPAAPGPGVQLRATGGGARAGEVDPATDLGAGESLDGATAARMGAAFGDSFADVRVHTEAPAAAKTQSLGAHAMALGNHVAFAPGEYRPGTQSGDGLLAHELAHVVQQRGAAPVLQQRAIAVDTSDAHERDADTAADAVMARLYGDAPDAGPVRPSLATGLGVQRGNRPEDKPGKPRKNDGSQPIGMSRQTYEQIQHDHQFALGLQHEEDREQPIETRSSPTITTSQTQPEQTEPEQPPTKAPEQKIIPQKLVLLAKSLRKCESASLARTIGGRLRDLDNDDDRRTVIDLFLETGFKSYSTNACEWFVACVIEIGPDFGFPELHRCLSNPKGAPLVEFGTYYLMLNTKLDQGRVQELCLATNRKQHDDKRKLEQERGPYAEKLVHHVLCDQGVEHLQDIPSSEREPAKKNDGMNQFYALVEFKNALVSARKADGLDDETQGTIDYLLAGLDDAIALAACFTELNQMLKYVTSDSRKHSPFQSQLAMTIMQQQPSPERPTILPTGHESHATITMLSNDSGVKGSHEVTHYNTGDGVEHTHPHKQLDGREKYQTFVRVKNVTPLMFKSYDGFNFWNAIVGSKLAYSMSALYEVLAQLKKAGADPDLPRPEVADCFYELKQSSGTCTWQSLMAMLRHQILLRCTSEPVGLYQYKLLKCTMSGLVFDEMMPFVSNTGTGATVKQIATHTLEKRRRKLAEQRLTLPSSQQPESKEPEPKTEEKQPDERKDDDDETSS